MMGKAQSEMWEVSGPIALVVRKQRQWWPSTLFLLYIQPRTSAHGIGLPVFRMTLPSSA